MHWDDLAQVAGLEFESFPNPWPPYSFELSLNNPDIDALVMKESEIVVAYLIASERDGEYLIANIAVSKKHRRKGLARRLVTKALELAEGRGAAYAVLEVRESNHGAIRLYESLGFRFVKRNPGYYSLPPEDALIMAKRI